MSPNKIIITPRPPSENDKIQKLIAKYIFECFEKGKGKTAKHKYSRT